MSAVTVAAAPEVAGAVRGRSPGDGRAVGRAPVHRRQPGGDPGSAAVPDRPRQPQLRQRLGADPRGHARQFGRPAAVRPHLRPALAALADADRADPGRGRSGADRDCAQLRAHLRRRAPQWVRSGCLSPRGVAVCQLRLGPPPLERNEPVQRRRQRRVCPRAGPGHAAGAGLRTVGHAVCDHPDVADGPRPRPRVAAPEHVSVRSDRGPGANPATSGCLEAVCPPRRGHRAALVRLLRLCDLHPPVLHPPTCTPAMRWARRR